MQPVEGGAGVTLAYYAPLRDWIVSRIDMVEQTVPNVIPHEVGHYFSLPHPFNGWDQIPWNLAQHGNPVTMNTAPDGQTPVEVVARNNCNTSGNFLCGTPADYNLGFNWGGCAPYTGGVMDKNNDLLAPQQENVMGYFFNCGDYEFVQDQIDMMIADYLSVSRHSIRDDDFIPVQGPINGISSIVNPPHNTTTDYFDNVNLEWTEVDGADRYYVEVSTNRPIQRKC